MADQPLASITLAGDLSKPATVLIEKISNAVGGVFKPYQIVRVAKAEAEAARIQEESKIQITDLQKRALHRFLVEEAKKQANMEAITQDALPLLEDNSTPQNMADDWVTNFFDKSRIISDSDMQQLWARVLAGEANTPGKFARQTVNRLGDIDKDDAELFTRLCGFAWLIGDDFLPLVFDYNDEIYAKNGIFYTMFTHLESLALIHCDTYGIKKTHIAKTLRVSYYGRQTELTFQADRDNNLGIGSVLLTRAGKQLASVCGSKPVQGFYEYVYDKWAAHRLVAKREGSKPPLPDFLMQHETSPGAITPETSSPIT